MSAVGVGKVFGPSATIVWPSLTCHCAFRLEVDKKQPHIRSSLQAKILAIVNDSDWVAVFFRVGGTCKIWLSPTEGRRGLYMDALPPAEAATSSRVKLAWNDGKGAMTQTKDILQLRRVSITSRAYTVWQY